MPVWACTGWASGRRGHLMFASQLCCKIKVCHLSLPSASSSVVLQGQPVQGAHDGGVDVPVETLAFGICCQSLDAHRSWPGLT